MYIRNPTRCDGFGAQMQNIIWNILFAEHNNMEFVYYPIKEMDHNYTKDPDYESKLINYTNITRFYKVGEVPSDQIFNNHKDDKILYSEVEAAMDLYHNGKPLEKLKRIFRFGKISPFDTEHVHIAIHIRRPNQIDAVGTRATDVPNLYFLDIMNRLRKEYTDVPIQFHIYSQGSIDNFKELSNNDVIFHLDAEMTFTFSSFVYADVLIMSASSLSYSAAILSNGRIISPRFWHPPMKSWEVMEHMIVKG
jgi:hypothetical protein